MYRSVTKIWFLFPWSVALITVVIWDLAENHSAHQAFSIWGKNKVKNTRYLRLAMPWCLVLLVLSGCKPDPGLPSDGSSSNTSKPVTHSFALSQGEFNQLSPEDQYMVMNKAMSTFMRGVPADEFFDTSKGLENPVVRNADSLARLQTWITSTEY